MPHVVTCQRDIAGVAGCPEEVQRTGRVLLGHVYDIRERGPRVLAAACSCADIAAEELVEICLVMSAAVFYRLSFSSPFHFVMASAIPKYLNFKIQI